MKSIFTVAWIRLSCLSFLARWLSGSLTKNQRYSVFMVENGDLVLVRHKLGIIQHIPDQFTANLLLSSEHSDVQEHVEISNISINVFRLFKKGPDIPSLVQTSDSPDEKLRVIVDKATAIAPAFLFITEARFLKGHSRKEGAYNPSFTRWSPPPQYTETKPILHNFLLFSWRTGDINSRIRFGWYDKLSHSITEIPVPEQPDPALNTTAASSIDRTGLIPISYVPGHTMGRYFATQEDPRVLSLSDGSVIVIYAGSFGKFDMNFRGNRDCLQMISIGRYDNLTSSLQFAPTVVLQYPEGGHQKNWVPFEYNGTLHFMQSIHPLHVVALDSIHSERHAASVRTVHRDAIHPNLTLPWRGQEYGAHLRGSTPAILVRGLYLAVFHTQINLKVFYSLNTYFMGAVSFCPHPPFRMHSISAYPIVDSKFYEGNWVPKFHNYVVFPSGLVLEEGGTHLLLSMGHQDMSAWVIRLEVDGLLDSMDIVNEC